MLLQATVCSAVAVVPQLVLHAIQEVLCYQQAQPVNYVIAIVLLVVLELLHHAHLALSDLLLPLITLASAHLLLQTEDAELIALHAQLVQTALLLVHYVLLDQSLLVEAVYPAKLVVKFAAILTSRFALPALMDTM